MCRFFKKKDCTFNLLQVTRLRHDNKSYFIYRNRLCCFNFLIINMFLSAFRGSLRVINNNFRLASADISQVQQDPHVLIAEVTLDGCKEIERDLATNSCVYINIYTYNKKESGTSLMIKTYSKVFTYRAPSL